MCRRCGEPDRRGPAHQRRRRRQFLLDGLNGHGGNGVLTVCVHCDCLVGNVAGHLEVGGGPGRWVYLEIRRLEVDRIRGLGSPYNLTNVQPSCGPCNRSRTYAECEVPEGCAFGSEIVAPAM